MKIPHIVRCGLIVLDDDDSTCLQDLLNVAVPGQEDTLWCWAAVAVGIADFYGHAAAKQHEIASAVLGLPCLPNGKNPNCHCEALLEDALAVHSNFDAFETPLEFALIQKAICSNRPLCARMEAGTAGHFVVIRGFDEIGEEVTIADPESRTTWIGPYREFRTAYRGVYQWKVAYSTQP